MNRLWPLDELERAVDDWRTRTGRRPSIEWMIHGVNDGDDQARLLGGRARRMHAHVNLIPMNPTPHSAYRPSPPQRIRSFADTVRAAGVAVTVRDTRGREIDAACGQLHWDAAATSAAQHPVGDRELPAKAELEAATRS